MCIVCEFNYTLLTLCTQVASTNYISRAVAFGSNVAYFVDDVTKMRAQRKPPELAGNDKFLGKTRQPRYNSSGTKHQYLCIYYFLIWTF